MKCSLQALAMAVFLALTAICNAQGFDTETLKVTIRHMGTGAGEVTLDPNVKNKNGSQLLGSNPSFRLPHGWRANVYIVDKNPILFTYAIGPIEATETESYAALKTLAEAVRKFVANSKALATADGARPAKHFLVVEGINTFKLSELVSSVANDYQQIGTWIDESFQKPLSPGTTADHGDIVDLKSRVSEAEKRASNLTKELDKLSSLTIKIARNASIEAQYGLANNALVPLKEGTWFELRRNTRAQFGDDAAAAVDEQLQFFDFVREEREALKKLATTIQSFSRVAAELHASSGPEATIEFDAKHDQKVPIRIGANSQFEEFFSPSAMAYQTKSNKIGEFSLTAKPVEKIHLSVAPGILYSFVKNPEFSAATAENGDITIEEKSSDYAAIDGMVSLNLTWDRYYGEGVEPFLQLGLAPSSDKTAFLLGVGFKAYKELVASIGVVYQRVNTLEGQEVGQALASADDLKTKKEFKAGFYIGLGVDF